METGPPSSHTHSSRSRMRPVIGSSRSDGSPTAAAKSRPHPFSRSASGGSASRSRPGTPTGSSTRSSAYIADSIRVDTRHRRSSSHRRPNASTATRVPLTPSTARLSRAMCSAMATATAGSAVQRYGEWGGVCIAAPIARPPCSAQIHSASPAGSPSASRRARLVARTLCWIGSCSMSGATTALNADVSVVVRTTVSESELVMADCRPRRSCGGEVGANQPREVLRLVGSRGFASRPTAAASAAAAHARGQRRRTGCSLIRRHGSG